MHIWDISGSKKYDWLLNDYVKQMNDVIFVCDINENESIHNVKYHWYDIIKNIKLDSFFYIAVNKCDSFNNKEKIILKINNFFRSIIDINNIFYISALSNKGITKMFSQIVDDIVKPKKNYIIPEKSNSVLETSVNAKTLQCVLI